MDPDVDDAVLARAAHRQRPVTRAALFAAREGRAGRARRAAVDRAAARCDGAAISCWPTRTSTADGEARDRPAAGRQRAVEGARTRHRDARREAGRHRGRPGVSAAASHRKATPCARALKAQLEGRGRAGESRGPRAGQPRASSTSTARRRRMRRRASSMWGRRTISRSRARRCTGTDSARTYRNSSSCSSAPAQLALSGDVEFKSARGLGSAREGRRLQSWRVARRVARAA